MAVRRLRISPDLALPIESVTESIAILAKRGAGKTYAASVLVEEMLKAKLQVVVLDPMGAWWGLRSSADGKGEGFSIAILGGDHGDVPLEPTGGSVAADLLVDERLPAILDLASFSKNERRSFVAAFLERLYQRNREAMHVVLEEADLFAPEGKLKRAGDEQMLGAVYDLVRRGRGRGIGSTLITQRSASLSKEVLTQAEILLALRTTGPHDRQAIEEWIHFHGSKEERDVVLGSLHELPTGEAWAWWPVEGILKRIKIRKRETFDSSATPKPGQTQREPKTLADVDLAALQQRMAATIEKAKADDPRSLRKKILELEQLVKKQDRGLTKPRTETVVEEKIVEVPVPVFNGEVDRLQSIAESLSTVGAQLSEAATAVASAIEAATKERPHHGATRTNAGTRPGARRLPEVPVQDRRAQGRQPTAPRRAPQLPRERSQASGGDGSEVSAPQQRILNALAALEAIGVAIADKTQLALFAEASPKSSSYSNNLGHLNNQLGLIRYPRPSAVELTDAGRELADAGGAPSSVEELHAYVFSLVGNAKTRLLEVLIEAYPNAVSKDELAEFAGSSATSSSFSNNLGSLRSLGLIDYPSPGFVAAEPVLFMEAVAV